jgi:hypothetical protein
MQNATALDSDRTYQIFKKEPDNTTVCVETVKGLQQARKSVLALVRTGSGDFFIFDPIAGTAIEPSDPSPSPDPLTP